MALKKLQVNDLIVQIPNNLLLTKERIMHEWLVLNSFSLTTAEALTLFLLHCKKENTHQLYTSLLPSKFSIAAMCTDDEICTLPIHLQESILTSKKQYRRKFEKISEVWEKVCGHDVSPQDFHWAWCAVNTRAVYYKDSADASGTLENNMALAPYLDMLNHSSETRITAGYNLKTQCYEIRTLDSVKRFHEVFINYGPHDNVKLFIEYGFVVPGNPQAVVEFDLLLLEGLFSKELSGSTIKKKLLSQLASNKKMFCSREGLSWDAQTALTIVTTPEEKLINVSMPYDVNVRSEASLMKTKEMVVRELLCQLSWCRHKAVDIPNPSSSFTVAKCLLDDMCDILSQNL